MRNEFQATDDWSHLCVRAGEGLKHSLCPDIKAVPGAAHCIDSLLC